MFYLLLGFTIAIQAGLGAQPMTKVAGDAMLTDRPTAITPQPSTGFEAADVVQTDSENQAVSLLDGISGGSPKSLLDGIDAPSSSTASGAAESIWQPEPQEVSGKFTTATEVKPILTSTKSHWAAIREYDGKDILYFSNLLGWRCGLLQISYSINDGPAQILPMEECHLNTGQPNAMTMESHMPFVNFELGSLKTVKIMIVYDDASQDSASFQRSDILMP